MDSKQTNFWNSGSLGIVIYLITILSIITFSILKINLVYSVFIFIGTVLLYSVMTAVALRDNEKLSEKNFLQLMTIALSKIPLLSIFFKKIITLLSLI